MSTMRDLKFPTGTLTPGDTAVYSGSQQALNGQRVEILNTLPEGRYIVALLNADGSAVTDHRGERRLLTGVHTGSLLVPMTEDEVRSATAHALFSTGYCVCGDYHPVHPATEHDDAVLYCPTLNLLVWEHDLLTHFTNAGI